MCKLCDVFEAKCVKFSINVRECASTQGVYGYSFIANFGCIDKLVEYFLQGFPCIMKNQPAR